MTTNTYKITSEIADAIGRQAWDDSDALYAEILKAFRQQGLTVRPTPRPTDAELDAIDGIRAAYLKCNSTDHDGHGPSLAVEVTPGASHGHPPTAMGHLAEAARRAWDALGLPGDYLWELMQDSGEDARYVHGYWRREVGQA